MCPGIPQTADSHYFRDIPVFDEARDLKSWAPMCDSNGSLYKLNGNTGISWKLYVKCRPDAESKS